MQSVVELFGWGHSTYHQGHKRVLPHRPRKAEKCIHKNAKQNQDLELEHKHGCLRHKGDVPHQLGGFVGGAHQGQQAANDDDRGGRKERRRLGQVLCDQAVQHARITGRRLQHPQGAVAVGGGDQ